MRETRELGTPGGDLFLRAEQAEGGLGANG